MAAGPTETYPDFRDDYVTCPSGLVLPETVARARYAPTAPAVIDLFCGCGGMSLGLKQAGWRILAAIDNDPAAAVTYMVNLCRYGEYGMHFVEDSDKWRLNDYIEREWTRGKKKKEAIKPWVAGSGWIAHQPCTTTGTAHFIFGDIRRLTGKRLLDIVGMKPGEVDCVAASPPCQGFSRANAKRGPDDPRNSLVWEWLRIVLDVQPKTIVMENVPDIVDMVTPEGVPVFDQIARVLEDGSFTTIDALRRTLKQQAGHTIGIVRRKPVVKPAKAASTANTDQIDLFEGGAA